MLFPSYIFLFVFGPIAIIGYWLIRNQKARRTWLTVMSYIFYGYWKWQFCALLLVSTIVDFFVGKKLASVEEPGRRKFWLIVSLAANLGMLGFFKYYMLLAASANEIAGWLGAGPWLPGWEIVLPIGISFFTFQSMSYTIDIYRREIKPTGDIIEFAAYVSLFPQLIAGPIVRYSEVYKTLRNLPAKLSLSNLNLGLFYFTAGLVKKVLIADRIAYFSDPMFQDYTNLVPIEAWLAILGFSLQLYFDFAGYSLMAIGLGYLLGLEFPQNFNSPYKAVSISDFWRRWHMTLSRWLRDYLYIPLGGRNNRFIALAVTMLLGGLWHGAAWTYMIWGAYHAVLLELHHHLKRFKWIPKNIAWARIGTFLLVTIGWVFFKPESLEASLTILKKMFDFANFTTLVRISPLYLLILLIALLWAMLGPNMVDLIRNKEAAPRRAWAIALGFLAALCVLFFSEASPFLYFQF